MHNLTITSKVFTENKKYVYRQAFHEMFGGKNLVDDYDFINTMTNTQTNFQP